MYDKKLAAYAEKHCAYVLWYQSYNDGRQQALYEAIAIIKSHM